MVQDGHPAKDSTRALQWDTTEPGSSISFPQALSGTFVMPKPLVYGMRNFYSCHCGGLCWVDGIQTLAKSPQH